MRLIRISSIILLGFSTILAPLPSADAKAADLLTLRDAVKLALENEEAVKLAYQDIEKAKLEKSRALKALFPDLSLSSSYQYYGYENDEEGGMTTEDQYGYTFSLNQALYTGGRALSARRSSERRIDASTLYHDLTREDIFLLTAEAYFNVLSSMKVVEASRLGVKQALEFRELVKVKFELGDATRTSILKAEFELSQRENELVTAENALEVARQVLKKIIGREFDSLAAEEKDLSIDPDKVSKDELINQALLERKELRMAADEVEMAREGVRYARGQFLPLLYVNGYYANSGSKLPPDESESWGASINIDIPIYDRGLSLNDLESARIDLTKSELAQSQLRKNIRLEVEEKYHRLKGFKSTVKSLKKQVELAAEGSRGVKKQYEVGLSTDLDVTESLFDLLSARVLLARQEFNLIIAELQLQKAVGSLVIPE